MNAFGKLSPDDAANTLRIMEFRDKSNRRKSSPFGGFGGGTPSPAAPQDPGEQWRGIPYGITGNDTPPPSGAAPGGMNMNNMDWSMSVDEEGNQRMTFSPKKTPDPLDVKQKQLDVSAQERANAAAQRNDLFQQHLGPGGLEFIESETQAISDMRNKLESGPDQKEMQGIKMRAGSDPAKVDAALEARKKNIISQINSRQKRLDQFIRDRQPTAQEMKEGRALPRAQPAAAQTQTASPPFAAVGPPAAAAETPAAGLVNQPSWAAAETPAANLVKPPSWPAMPVTSGGGGDPLGLDSYMQSQEPFPNFTY